MKKVALVGFGHAGRVFHAPLIEYEEGLELTSIVSSRKEEIKSLYPSVEVLSNFEDVFKKEIDLIVIATPNHMHFSQASAALDKGVHVVIDKPVAQTLKEAVGLNELAIKKNLILSVFHNRRFDGDFLTVRKLLAENKVGKLAYFESNFNRFRPKVDSSNWRETTDYAGGIFYDLAPHLIDQVVSLFGLPKRVMTDKGAMRQGAKNDDYFHLILDYEDKKIHLNASVLTAYAGERFKIHGDKDSYIKLGLDVQEGQLKKGIPLSDKSFGVDTNHGKLQNAGAYQNIDGNYQGYYKNISKALEGKETVEVTMQQVIDVMHLIEECNKSYKNECWQKVNPLN